MDEKVQYHRQLIEAIDASSPGELEALPISPELARLAELTTEDDELAALVDRSQRFDSAVRRAMADVPVPSGLQERLLVAVAAAEAPRAPGPSEAVDRAIDPGVPAAPRGAAMADRGETQSGGRPAAAPWLSRRRVLAAVAAVAAVAAILTVVVLVPMGPTGVAEERVVQDIELAYLDRLQGVEGWRTDHALPEGFSPPPGVSLGPLRAWQSVRVWGCRGIAYEVANPRPARKAVVLVIQRRVRGLPGAPPISPQSTTLGRCVGVWQSESYVYALIVEGTEPQYRQFVSPRSGLT